MDKKNERMARARVNLPFLQGVCRRMEEEGLREPSLYKALKGRIGLLEAIEECSDELAFWFAEEDAELTRMREEPDPSLFLAMAGEMVDTGDGPGCPSWS
ncbi:hypothetical protein N6H14_04595 [Paenibacillus sp. CC-CFT747]|nr:hypothetical protein N6H14_04595 [Paenibacillus sp. CC-CFT747]